MDWCGEGVKGPEAEQRAVRPVLQRIPAFQAPDAFVSCQPPERKVRGFAQVDQPDRLRPSRRESSRVGVLSLAATRSICIALPRGGGS